MQIHELFRKDKNVDLILSWEELTDGKKDYNRYPARHLAIKLRYLGAELVEHKDSREPYYITDATDTQKTTIAKMEHLRWNAEKTITGFVKGDVILFEKEKGLEKKQQIESNVIQEKLKVELKWHKDIRNWDELTIEDKEKDLRVYNEMDTILKSVEKIEGVKKHLVYL